MIWYPKVSDSKRKAESSDLVSESVRFQEKIRIRWYYNAILSTGKQHLLCKNNSPYPVCDNRVWMLNS